MSAEKEFEVLLPRTEKDLESFVQSLVMEYGLPDGDDTMEAIATMILHLPGNKATCTRSYFANSVFKSMANRAAYAKMEEFRRKRQEAAEKQKAELTLVQPEPSSASDEPVQNA